MKFSISNPLGRCVYGALLTLLATAASAAPNAPTGIKYEINASFTWVLIHSDVSFLIPSYRSGVAGQAAITWSAVAGATSYQYRVFINGAWSSWTSVGAQTYANVSGIGDGSVPIEVIACDASGCSASSSVTLLMSSWISVGQCDPATGQQTQVCVNGQYCALNALRAVNACTISSADCSN